MISTANLTMQFGARPLFENVSVRFGAGNRYGLIGANVGYAMLATRYFDRYGLDRSMSAIGG